MNQSLQHFVVLIILTLSSLLIFGSPSSAAEKFDKDTQQIPSLVVNINEATAEELADILVGIGLKKAQTIVKHREQTGSFKSIDELLEVKGIGNATLEKNRHKLKL